MNNKLPKRIPLWKDRPVLEHQLPEPNWEEKLKLKIQKLNQAITLALKVFQK